MSLLRICGLALALVIGPAAARADDEKDKPLDDKTFVEKAYGGGLAEVEISKTAQTSATNAAVKTCAERMIKDHTAWNEELKTIAAGIPVPVPDRVDDQCRKDLDKISKLSGAEFDKAFMDFQVKAHEEAVKCCKKADTALKNARLKEFAEKALPKLEEHLKLAKETRDQLK